MLGFLQHARLHAHCFCKMHDSMLIASAKGAIECSLLAFALQDALGRSALMFGAGNCAEAALLALLAAGATLGLRDRRSRSVLDYAPEGSKVKQQLLDR